MTGRASVIFFLSAIVLAAQVPVRTRTPTVAPITAINITGNRNIGVDAILTASGLKKDENGGTTIFDAARERLLATGYFDLVTYAFHTEDLGFAVTFSVIETKEAYPLHIDGLPITAEQAARVIGLQDPLFHGLLPATKPAMDRAASAVEQYLMAISPGLGVHAKVVTTDFGKLEMQLAPAEGLPVIADVAFEGNSLIHEQELRDAILEGAIGQVYSDGSVRALLDRFIRPLYDKQGYMRVSFPKITGAPAANVKGIDVKVTVSDGGQYKLGPITVRGPMAGDSKRLLRIAKLPAMSFMNGDEFDQAVPRLRNELRGEGYLDVTVTTDHSLDEAGKTVSAWFEIQPGALYTFGKLEVLGLGLEGEAAIRKMWSVKPGDPFPGDYPAYFAKRVKEDGLFDNLDAVTATPTIHNETHVVDVSLKLASAPQATQTRRSQF